MILATAVEYTSLHYIRSMGNLLQYDQLIRERVTASAIYTYIIMYFWRQEV